MSGCASTDRLLGSSAEALSSPRAKTPTRRKEEKESQRRINWLASLALRPFPYTLSYLPLCALRASARGPLRAFARDPSPLKLQLLQHSYKGIFLLRQRRFRSSDLDKILAFVRCHNDGTDHAVIGAQFGRST